MNKIKVSHGVVEMSSSKISSDTNVAAQAIAELRQIQVSNFKSQQVAFNYTRGISGMSHANQVTSKTYQTTTSLVTATKLQADNFFNISQTNEQRDAQDAHMLSGAGK